MACIVMICTMIPGVVFAAGESIMQPGAGVIATGDKVYFGQYGKEKDEVQWIALNDDGFLLSQYTIGSVRFRDCGYYPNFGPEKPRYYGEDWDYSVKDGQLKLTMDGLYDGEGTTLFTTPEQGAVAATVLTAESMDWVGKVRPLTVHLYPLSVMEIYDYSAREYVIDEALLVTGDINDKSNGNQYGWWTRTNDTETGVVRVGGRDSASPSTDEIRDSLAIRGVRPAFNLNMDSVLFTSAAVDSKNGSAVGADGLQQVLTAETDSYKLTLLDTARKNFTAELKTFKNDTGTIAYKAAVPNNAASAPDEYISAIITDKDISESGCKIRYYGRILKPSQEDGTTTINLAGKYSDGDKLYIFSEQYNGDKRTDYASPLIELAIKETPAAEEFEFTPPINLTYDGKEKIATVTLKTGVDGMGEVTVKYYDNAGNELASPPKKAGKYTVKIDVSAGDKYLPEAGLTSEEWSFTITKALPAGKDKNKSANEPGTGDDSNIALWVVLAMIAVLAAAGTVIARKRKQKQMLQKSNL